MSLPCERPRPARFRALCAYSCGRLLRFVPPPRGPERTPATTRRTFRRPCSRPRRPIPRGRLQGLSSRARNCRRLRAVASDVRSETRGQSWGRANGTPARTFTSISGASAELDGEANPQAPKKRAILAITADAPVRLSDDTGSPGQRVADPDDLGSLRAGGTAPDGRRTGELERARARSRTPSSGSAAGMPAGPAVALAHEPLGTAAATRGRPRRRLGSAAASTAPTSAASHARRRPGAPGPDAGCSTEPRRRDRLRRRARRRRHVVRIELHARGVGEVGGAADRPWHRRQMDVPPGRRPLVDRRLGPLQPGGHGEHGELPTTSVAPTVGTWQHVVGTWDGAVLRL